MRYRIVEETKTTLIKDPCLEYGSIGEASAMLTAQQELHPRHAFFIEVYVAGEWVRL